MLADGFYEFTASTNPQQKKKDCWLFEPKTEVAIAGLVRANAKVGEAFTLLTVPPGPDIMPYHQREVALLQPDKWRAWLEGSARCLDALQPSGAGSLSVSARS